MSAACGFAVVLALAVVAAAANTPSGPVIGILTQNGFEETNGGPYIAASYVKYLESAGARVVPILHTSSPDTIATLFSRLNGVLYPGGGVNLANSSDPFMVTARHLFDLAAAENAAGGYFPLWGTCLGFQTLSVLASSAAVLDSGFDSENLPLPLTFTELADKSRLFSSVSPSIKTSLATENVTMNNHQDGVSPKTFATDEKLSAFFNVLSTNVDRQGRPFASSIEAKKAPVYGTQWHPEKNAFEWTPKEAIPHSSDAIEVCHSMASFFVNEARKNSHTYPYDELMKDIIWNYNPTFSGRSGGSFDQIYEF